MAEILLPNAGQLERIISLMGGDKDIYGVGWNKVTDEVTRIEQNKNLTQTDFSKIMPWAGMKRCTVQDNGVVTSYFGDTNYVEDGSIGQVMVEIPKFYYNSFLTNGYRWEISPNKKSGFKLHPAFTDGVKIFDKIYFSAFEGSVYDVSDEVYLLDDEQIADFAVDKLSSIANSKPCSGATQSLTIDNARKLAVNRGSGWQQQDFTTTSAIQLLFLIEYASFNTQSEIGMGVVDKSSSEGNSSEITGGTSHLGNVSGMANGVDGLVSVSYRGIENFWGNIWKLMDGLNISNYKAYVSLGEYQSDKFDSPYVEVGIVSKESGYISDIIFNEGINYGFLPINNIGSSNSYIPDNYRISSGSRVAFVGGLWSYGASAGGFALYLNSGSSTSSSARGCRLLLKK